MKTILCCLALALTIAVPRAQSQDSPSTAPAQHAALYVVLQFATRFEHKADATEFVTPARAKDGSWKVSGYFIK